MRKRLANHTRYLTTMLLALLLASCSSTTSQSATPTNVARPIPTLFPTVPAAPTASADGPTAPDTGWIAGSNGIELRTLRLALADERSATVTIARLDTSQVRLRVGYTPEQPRSLQAWFSEYEPLLAVNGGFFTETYHSTALVVSDGSTSEASYEGFGGMLAVHADGSVAIQPLRDQPYDPSVQLDQAMQSFPMLVFPGGSAADLDDSERSRRTAVALDTSGRLLVVVCSSSSFSLLEFAEWLAASDLEIDRALNLDGGTSTGMYVDAGSAQERIEPFGTLPLVLLAEAR